MFELLIRLFKKSKKSTLNWAARVDKWIAEDFGKSTY